VSRTISPPMAAAPFRPFINTVASARCADALSTWKLFQQFVARRAKLLKRPRSCAQERDRIASLHRAEATVSMKGFVRA
jgi:hypothetical protein